MIDYKNENATDLAYFISLQEKQPEDVLDFFFRKMGSACRILEKGTDAKEKGR